jgi:secernin
VCDCLVALAPATTGTVTVWAKNSDRPADEAQRLARHPPRRDEQPVRTTYIEVAPRPGDTIGVTGSRPWWCWGFEHGVNDAGVAAGNETIFTTLDPKAAEPALIGMDLVRLGLERGETAAAAVAVITDHLERYGQGGSGHHGTDFPYWSSFLVGDATAAYVVETSGRTWMAEEVDRTRAISNRTTIPAFDAEHRHPGQDTSVFVDPRLEAGTRVLAHEPVTVAGMVAHLRSHEGTDGWSVCMHVPDMMATTASVVAELGERPLVRWLLGSPCTSVYVPVHAGRRLGEPPAWERFAALRTEHRPVLDELEASLAADVRDDDDWGPEAWRRVEAVLASLP